MKFAVTGGAGFLGSHFCDALLAQGHEVVAIDNFCTGRKENVAHLSIQPRFALIEHDVSQSFPNIGRVDGVCHLASPASPVDFVSKALDILRVGSAGTFNSLEYARAQGAWFFLASTSEVYGDPLVHPQTEDYFGNVNPNGIRGVYDESKRFAESVTSAYRRLGKAQTSIVRIFNTYGPRMRADDGRVVCTFIQQALTNQDLTVFGDGSQTRSFCYVDDLIAGFMRFVETRAPGPLNLGNPTELSMLGIAEKILQKTGSKSRITFAPLPEGDPKQRQPDLTRTREALGWQPKVSLDEGLDRTIAYFKSKLTA